MKRYIDADLLLQYIGATEHCKDCEYNNNDYECRSHSLSRQDICNIIEDLYEESADVRENVKGEWILHQDSKTWECSVCGEYQVVWSNFCMHCGAEMGVK